MEPTNQAGLRLRLTTERALACFRRAGGWIGGAVTTAG